MGAWAGAVRRGGGAREDIERGRCVLFAWARGVGSECEQWAQCAARSTFAAWARGGVRGGRGAVGTITGGGARRGEPVGRARCVEQARLWRGRGAVSRDMVCEVSAVSPRVCGVHGDGRGEGGRGAGSRVVRAQRYRGPKGARNASARFACKQQCTRSSVQAGMYQQECTSSVRGACTEDGSGTADVSARAGKCAMRCSSGSIAVAECEWWVCGLAHKQPTARSSCPARKGTT